MHTCAHTHAQNTHKNTHTHSHTHQFAGALATAMEMVRDTVGPGRSLELLRKESLEGLPPTSASKVGCCKDTGKAK